MWVPKSLISLFAISKESIEAQRLELNLIRSERDLLKTQLATTQANFNWLTGRVNSLEVERAQLIKRAYGIETLIPEIVRRPEAPQVFQSDLFEDVGDKIAKSIGLPVYESPFTNQSN